MVQTPLAFDFSKTRTICDAFDDAWAFLQARGSELHGSIQLTRDAHHPGQAHYRDGRSRPDGRAETPR